MRVDACAKGGQDSPALLSLQRETLGFFHPMPDRDSLPRLIENELGFLCAKKNNAGDSPGLSIKVGEAEWGFSPELQTWSFPTRKPCQKGRLPRQLS